MSTDMDDPTKPDNADAHKAPGDPTKHDMSVDRSKEHIDKKVYLFPESYNALRKELETFWPNLWATPIQFFMAFDAPNFCHFMDEALDTITQFDSANVDGICKKYLDTLRVKRGVKPLHNPSEYYGNAQMEATIRLARDVHENAGPKDRLQ